MKAVELYASPGPQRMQGILAVYAEGQKAYVNINKNPAMRSKRSMHGLTEVVIEHAHTESEIEHAHTDSDTHKTLTLWGTKGDRRYC